MNKNEFYKQLMSEYSFDADKIRANAKKGRFAKQKITPFAIGITATVAAATVACGTLAVTMLDNKNGVDLVNSGNSTLSNRTAEERIENAIKQQLEAQNSEEIIDILVTFTVPMHPAAAENVIYGYAEDGSSIPVKAVYLADGTRLSDSAQIAAAFSGSENIYAMAIEGKASLLAVLQSDPDIALAEDLRNVDLETAVPIAPEDMTEVELPDSTTDPETNFSEPEALEPISPDDTDTNVNTPGTESAIDDVIPPEDTEPSDDPALPEEQLDSPEHITDIPDENENSDTPEQGDDTEGPTEPELPAEPEIPSEPMLPEQPDAPEVPVQPETPAVTTPQLPAGVTLPTDPEKFSYTTVQLDAENAFFLSSNTILVTKEEEIALYEFYGETEELVTSEICRKPVTHWVSDSGSKLIVSGTDTNGIRNKLYLIDAGARAIYDLNAKDVIMDGTLTGAGYNAEQKLLFLCFKEEGIYYTACLKINSNTNIEYNGILFETAAKTTLLSSGSGKLYLSTSDGVLTQIYAIDVQTGSSRIIKTYDNSPRLVQNLAFTHAAVYPSATALTGNIEIFDPATESFIKTDSFSDTLSFGASKHSFSINGNIYTVSAGTLTSAGGPSVTAAIDYRRSFSPYYYAHAENGYITITESVYSAENKTGALVFTDITSSGSEEFRNILNGALGMRNALAAGACREAGITTQDELIECLPVYYSKNAVDTLKTLCRISDGGALDYTSGGLKPLRTSDTRLTIGSVSENTANGVLYIKAGTFGGKLAYRAVNVSFILENGVWKLDTIIK